MFKQKNIPALLSAIMAFTIFTRLWNLPAGLQFLGDQGRDAIIVANIFKHHDLVFIGPVTSVGNMYLGPLYYYFMVPFLWLSYPSPVGPAYAVAILSILTVFLMYYLGKELFNKPVALTAAGLMAASSTVVIYSRFSWNPNPAPFVSLLMIYGSYKAWKDHPKYLLLVALCFSILIQLHYLTLLSAAGAGLIYLISLRKYKVDKRVILFTVLGLFIFLTSLTPLVLFDSRHDWLNARAFQNMFVGEDNFVREETSPVQKIAQTIKETHGRSMHILLETNVGQHRLINTLILLAILLIYFGSNKKKFKMLEPSGEVVIGIYLLTGILGTAVYEHTIFDHYIAYLYPVAFFVLAYCLVWLYKSQYMLRFAAGAFVAWFLIYNIPRMPLKDAGWTIFDIDNVSQSILDRVNQGDKYNIVLLSESGDSYGQNYRYFLEASDRPPLNFESFGEANKLFIINEDRKLRKSTDSSNYWVVVFPDKNPKEVYTIDGGPEITVLEK